MFITQQLTVAQINVQMEVVSTFYRHHQVVLFVKVTLILPLILIPVFAHAKLVITMFLILHQVDLLFVSPVWLNFAEHVCQQMLLSALLVLLELLLDLTMFVIVFQDIMNRMVHVKFAQQNVMDVKLMEFAVLVLIQTIENLIKTVHAQLDYMMMVLQLVKLVILFAKPVRTQLHVLHVSPKITELL